MLVGVRPSTGAATSARELASDGSNALLRSTLAARKDGRIEGQNAVACIHHNRHVAGAIPHNRVGAVFAPDRVDSDGTSSARC